MKHKSVSPTPHVPRFPAVLDRWPSAIRIELLPKLLQKCRRILQIRRVKPLGEPLVHRGQQVGGVLALALGLPQASEAGGGAKFEGFGIFGTGYVEGLVEASLRSHHTQSGHPHKRLYCSTGCHVL